MAQKRLFKFRAWHTELNHMFYPDEEGNFTGEIDGDRVCSDFNYCEIFNTAVAYPYIPMQFTGLYDRSGKEIYEDDILKMADGKVAKVAFLNGAFYTPKDGSKYRLGGWKKQSIKCIGNIHANKDLLKNKTA